MDQIIQTLIIGLANGLLFALVALGYTLVYGIIELINFAHGDVFMVGSFVTLWLLSTIGVEGTIDDPGALGAELAAVPGIVEHGIFPGTMVERIVVAGPAGVHELVKPQRDR
jgi:branched-chain amino acid transport system permease protein